MKKTPLGIKKDATPIYKYKTPHQLKVAKPLEIEFETKYILSLYHLEGYFPKVIEQITKAWEEIKEEGYYNPRMEIVAYDNDPQLKVYATRKETAEEVAKRIKEYQERENLQIERDRAELRRLQEKLSKVLEKKDA